MTENDLKALLNSQTASSIVRKLLAIGGAFLIKHGLSEVESDAVMQKVAELVGGVLLVVVPMLWSRIQYRAALLMSPPRPATPPGTTGPRIASMLVFPLVVAVALACNGCGIGWSAPSESNIVTPESMLVGARNNMDSIETAILLGQVTGKISPKTAEELNTAMAVVHAAYDRLFEAYKSGNAVTFNDVHSAFNAALKEFLATMQAKGVRVEKDKVIYDRSGVNAAWDRGAAGIEVDQSVGGGS